MTVIGSFRLRGWPTLFGDLLLSGFAVRDVSIPSFHLPNEATFFGCRPDVAGLRQKIVIISDRLCLAWAGSYVQGHALIKFLRENCSGSSLCWSDFRATLSIYPASELNDVTFFAFFWDGSDFGEVDNVPGSSFELNDLTRVRIVGTGSAAFWAVIEDISEHFSSGVLQGETDDRQRGVTLALTCVGYHFGAQVFGGNGIEEGWGGGFEVAFFDGVQFRKADKVIYVFFQIDQAEDGALAVTLLQPFYYQYYVDDQLRILIDLGNSETDRLYAVDPPGVSNHTEITWPSAFQCASTVAVAYVKLWKANAALGVVVRTHAFEGCPIQVKKDENTTEIAINDGFVVEMLSRLQMDSSKLTTFSSSGWEKVWHAK